MVQSRVFVCPGCLRRKDMKGHCDWWWFPTRLVSSSSSPRRCLVLVSSFDREGQPELDADVR